MSKVVELYSSLRGKLNIISLIIAFVLSIMVVHTHNQCEDNKGFPKSAPFVSMSYAISIIMIVILCLIFSSDIALLVISKIKK